MVKINDSIYAVILTIREAKNSKYADSQICIINIKTESVKYIIFGKKKMMTIQDFCIGQGAVF